MTVWFTSLILLITLFSESAFSEEHGEKSVETSFEYAAYPDASNNFAEASFSAVIAPVSPRGILLLLGGTDSDSRPWLSDPRWLAFAEREQFILMGACLRGVGEAYEIASKGSGQALLDAIAALAKQTKRPEFTQLPLVIYGHSAGAMFGFNFACWKPERIRAILCVKSGPLSEPPQGMVPLFPALFIVGERDHPGRVRTVAQSFAAGRSNGAPWCLALQPNGGHGSDGCRDLAEAFVSAVISPNSEGASYAELAAPDKIQAGATDPNACWLPNASFAQTWRSFVKGLPFQSLLTLQEETTAKQLKWRPIIPLPETVDHATQRVGFEYAIFLPDDQTAIKEVKVTASHPAIMTTTTRLSDHEWNVVGECDLINLPLGSFESHLQAEMLTATGSSQKEKVKLFTRLNGPVSVTPASHYFGVVSRDTTADINLVLRSKSGHPFRSCEVVSSDPGFLKTSVAPSEKPDEYRAKCTIHSGSRIGEKFGRLTFRVFTEREYFITVRFYGFVKK